MSYGEFNAALDDACKEDVAWTAPTHKGLVICCFSGGRSYFEPNVLEKIASFFAAAALLPSQ